jgi:two-component system chemotaxis response regulator CheB
VVQSFEEALYDSMPRSAAAAVPECATATVADMPALLVKLLEEPVPVGQDPSALMQMEAELADMTPESLHDQERPGEPSGFGCPDCHGALFQIVDGPLTRFRCRVGHAWSPESLAARQTNDVESALWMGLRSLEEKAALSGKLEEQAVMRGHDLTAHRFAEEAAEARRAAELIRELIVNLEVTSSAPTEQGA